MGIARLSRPCSQRGARRRPGPSSFPNTRSSRAASRTATFELSGAMGWSGRSQTQRTSSSRSRSSPRATASC
eukprot:7816214-Pyramimonas_sp.AAC.1